MKCLILAAGYATRLYPLTENFPKPLLCVKDKPILSWLIEDLDTLGVINEYVVISNHRFAEHFRKWADGCEENITVLDDGTTANENRLGAVKDIEFAVSELNINEDVIVIAGDNLLDFSLTGFVEYASQKQCSCIMRYYELDAEKLKKCGVVTVDGDDRITCMEEKPAEPKSSWCCPPFYYYAQKDIPKISEGIRKGCGTDAPGSFIAWLCGQTKVCAMEMPGRRYDIGNIDSYREVQDKYCGIRSTI